MKIKHLSSLKYYAICTLQFAICNILFFALASCGTNNTSTEPGSVSFGLAFQKTMSKAALRSPHLASTGDVCFDYGLTTITGKVYNAATNQTVTGGPWPCSAHQGKINNVPPATGLSVIVEGTVNGSVVWTGQKTNVSVTAGQDSNVGTVPFIYVGGDTTPPAVASVSPANNAVSVPVTAAVTATFSEDMSATSIDTATFTLHQGATSVLGAVSYDVTAKKASFYPSTNFANSTAYTATISTNVKDLAMNSLATAHTWMFTTEAATGVAPAAPTNVLATAADKQVVISWATVSGATSYNVYWSTTSANASKSAGSQIPVTTSPYTHVSLANGTTYYYVVTAVNANGESTESSPVASATPGVAPLAPANVVVTPGNTQNVISWSTVTGATSYNIYWSLTSGVTKASGTKIFPIASSPFTHTGRTNGTTVYYVVTAMNSYGESIESTIASGAPGTAPSAPAGVAATAGNGQVTISWSAATGATSYNVYSGLAAGVTKVNGTKVTSVSNPYTFTGTNGTAYYFIVTSVNSFGESAASTEVTATPGAAPAAPTNVVATAGNTQNTISWTTSTLATSYNIYWSLSSGVTKTSVNKVIGATNPYNHTGLTNSTTYYYVVTAVNSYGESVVSTQVNSTPQPSGGGTAPINGLVAYYSFNGNANDLSGNGSNGVVNGATLTTDRFGTVNSSYAFNGSGNNISMGQVGINPTGIAVAVWFKSAMVNSQYMTVVSWNGTNVQAGGNGIQIYASGTGKMSGRIGDNSSTLESLANIDGDNTWHLFVVQRDASNSLKLYVDGILNASSVVTANLETIQPLFIGRSYQALGEYFHGSIDDVRIYNRALSDSEVLALYNESFDTVPAAPTGVTVTAGNAQNVISWPAVTGATSYNVYWSTTPGVTKSTGTPIASVTNPYTFAGTNGTTYYYVVTAVNAAGESAASQPVVSASPGTAPIVPAGVTATAGIGQVSISWPPATGATSYIIYWSTSSGVTKGTGTPINGVSSPYLFTGNNGTTYHFVVTASNSFGETSESNEVNATPSATPLPPTGVGASAGYGQITATWTAVNGATSYNVYYSLSPGVTTSNGTKVIAGASPYAVTGLADNTKYYFIVTAANGGAESAASSEVFATTWASPTPPGPPMKPRF